MSRVLGSWTLPLREASGLAVRRNPSGVGHQLLAVEDDLFAVGTAGIAGGVLTPDPDAIAVDLAPAGGTAEVVTWPLPRELFASRQHKAEGLAWAPGLGWLVALDIGRAETNLFLVEDRP